MSAPSLCSDFDDPPHRPGSTWSEPEKIRVISAAFDPSRAVYRYMYSVAARAVGRDRAEDAIQDFFFHVWKYVIPKFDPDEIEAALAVCPFAKWFWTSFFWFLPKWAGDQAGGAPSPGIGQPANPSDFDIDGWLRENLTADEYRLYKLIFVERRSQEEIAEILGVARETVARRKAALIAKIIELLRKDADARAALLDCLHRSGEAAPVLTRDSILASISTRIGTILDNHRNETPKAARDVAWEQTHAELKAALGRLRVLAENISEANSKTAPALIDEVHELSEKLCRSFSTARKNIEEVGKWIVMLIPPAPVPQKPDHNA